jgi:uncharacterized protein (DUF952 family)
MAYILHLVSADYFRSLPSDVPYLPHGFEDDGFIHCATGSDSVLQVANAFYRNAPGEFCVLVIDEDKLAAQVKYEPPAPVAGGVPDAADVRLYPHIYGPLHRDAIVDVVGVRRAPDGTFTGFARALD